MFKFLELLEPFRGVLADEEYSCSLLFRSFSSISLALPENLCSLSPKAECTFSRLLSVWLKRREGSRRYANLSLLAVFAPLLDDSRSEDPLFFGGESALKSKEREDVLFSADEPGRGRERTELCERGEDDRFGGGV